MAKEEVKLTELMATTILNNGDIFPLVQIFGASKITKYITWANLKTLILGIIGPTELTGVIKEYGGSVLPSGYLWCNGQIVSRTTYAALFAAIGTTHGAGDGSTTFRVPNKMGKVTIGREGMGGVSPSGVITSASLNGANAVILGGTGGEQVNTLTLPQMPEHDHASQIFSSAGSGTASNGSNNGNLPTVTGLAGGNQPHNNTQPWVAGNFIIKT